MFSGTRKNLEEAKKACTQAKSAFDAEMANLIKESARLQRDQYLDSFLIRDAKLPRISATAILSLSSFGFETAMDVKNIRRVKVPGIGPVLTERLEQWREELSRKFTPKAGVPDADRVALARIIQTGSNKEPPVDV
jgi:DNA-binding helix-hairpin-helix protein with protein kinase domain